MLKITRIKPLLAAFVLTTLALTLVLAIIVNGSLGALSRHSEYEHTVTDQLVNAIATAKLQTVEVQQYTTDSAATGDLDGLADAEKSARAAIEAVQLIARLAPPLVSTCAAIASDIQRLQQTGERMAAAYRQSREAGNAVMKASDGFDAQTMALLSAVRYWQNKLMPCKQRQRAVWKGIWHARALCRGYCRLLFAWWCLLPALFCIAASFRSWVRSLQ